MTVTVMRIDDRLIHGQIVTRWIADAKANTILIADDLAASDPTQQMLLKLVAPANIELLIKSIKDAVVLLRDDKAMNGNVLLMVRNPAAALELVKLVIPITSINIGNISNSKSETGRKGLLSYVYVEKQDVDCLKQIAEMGIHLDVRAVPNDKSIDGLELLSKY